MISWAVGRAVSFAMVWTTALVSRAAYPNLLFELEHDLFRQFFPDAGNFREVGAVAATYRACECFVVGKRKDVLGAFGSDAGNADQETKEGQFLQKEKSVEFKRVLFDGEVGKERGVAPGLRRKDGRRRDEDDVSDSARRNEQCAIFFTENLPLDMADHVLSIPQLVDYTI